MSNPVLGLLSAFLSHYIIDTLPVWEYKIENIKKGQWNRSRPDFLKVFLDIAIGFILVFIFSKDIFLGTVGGFLAMIPDGLTLLLKIFPKTKILNIHHRLHAKFNWFRSLENKKTGVLPIFLEIYVFLAVIYLSTLR